MKKYRLFLGRNTKKGIASWIDLDFSEELTEEEIKFIAGESVKKGGLGDKGYFLVKIKKIT